MRNCSWCVIMSPSGLPLGNLLFTITDKTMPLDILQLQDVIILVYQAVKTQLKYIFVCVFCLTSMIWKQNEETPRMHSSLRRKLCLVVSAALVARPNRRGRGQE